MIPDDAVEAGYAAMNYLAIGRDEIRAILEAAAPHMLAGAVAESEPVQAVCGSWDCTAPECKP